jgi:hypothetical protein
MTLIRLHIAAFFAVGLFGCIPLTPENNLDAENTRHMTGEILVEMHVGYFSNDLDSLLADIEPERSGGFYSEIHRVAVPEGQEKHWADLLRKEEIIRAADLNRFGYSYNLVERDGFPHLKGDSLYVKVGYSGCGPGHDFTLESLKTGSSSYEVWLFKEYEEDCLAFFSEVRAFKIPDGLKNAQSIKLVKPVNERVELVWVPAGDGDSIRFGDPYTLHQSDGFPYLQGDSLFVWISYTGCGGETVSLEYFRTGPSS